MNKQQFNKGDSVIAKADIERPSDRFSLFHKMERYLVIDVPDEKTVTVMGNGTEVELIPLDDSFDTRFYAVHGDDQSWKRTPTGWIKDV